MRKKCKNWSLKLRLLVDDLVLSHNAMLVNVTLSFVKSLAARGKSALRNLELESDLSEAVFTPACCSISDDTARPCGLFKS